MHDIEVKSADDFIADTLELNISKSFHAIEKMRNRFKIPELIEKELISKMESVGLTVSAGLIWRYREAMKSESEPAP